MLWPALRSPLGDMGVGVGDINLIKVNISWCNCLFLQLVSQKKIDKNLLPPKKIIGKNSKSLVEKRQKELEVYLQALLVKFPFAAPKVLSHFLHFHLYVSLNLPVFNISS